MTQIHASCVEVEGVGVLLCGRSGSGKSDLVLRLVDGGARLVADDRTDLAAEGGALVARCPAPLAGRLEVRGIGIVRLAAVSQTAVGLVCDLVAADGVERLPEADWCDIEGIAVRRVRLAPFEASAPAKVRLAARQVRSHIMPPQ